MAELNEYKVDVSGTALSNIAEQTKIKLSLTSETEKILMELSRSMKGNPEIPKVIEIAIELLLHAKDKEIQLVDKRTNKIAEAYYLWK